MRFFIVIFLFCYSSLNAAQVGNNLSFKLLDSATRLYYILYKPSEECGSLTPGSYSIQIISLNGCNAFNNGTSNSINLNLNSKYPDGISKNTSDACSASSPTNCNPPFTSPIISRGYFYNFLYFNFPLNCDEFRLVFTSFWLADSLTNLPNNLGHYESHYISFKNGVFNNSVPITDLQLNQTLCNNKNARIDFGAVDPDGDSLVYELDTAKDRNNVNLPYLLGTSPKNPLQNCGLKFNQNTGLLKFKPNQLQYSHVKVRVNEFRNNILVGSTQKDVWVQVRNSPNCRELSLNNISSPNCALQFNSYINFDTFGCYKDSALNYNLSYCSAKPFQMQIQLLNKMKGPVKLEKFIGDGNLSDLNVNKKDSLRNFNLSIPNPTPGKRNFTLVTHNCPDTGLFNYKYLDKFNFKINFIKTPKLSKDTIFLCNAGGPKSVSILDLDSGVTAHWSHNSGFLTSNSDSTEIKLFLNHDTVYHIQYSYLGVNNCNSCKNTDTLYVKFVSDFNYTVAPKNSSICINDSKQINVIGDSLYKPYSLAFKNPIRIFHPITLLSLDSQKIINITNPLLRPFNSGHIAFDIIASNGCAIQDSVFITVIDSVPHIAAQANRPYWCNCDTTKLSIINNVFSYCGKANYPINNPISIINTNAPSFLFPTNAPLYSSYPSIFGVHAGKSAKHRMMIHHTELKSLGVAGKLLSEISLYSGNTKTNIFKKVRIKLGCSNSNTLNSSIPMIEMAYFDSIEIWNNKKINFPLNGWGYAIGYDDNLFIDICFENDTNIALGNNQFFYEYTSYPSIGFIHGNKNMCNADSFTTTLYQRPKMSFKVTSNNSITNPKYKWSPAAFFTNDTIANPTISICTPTTLYLSASSGICQTTDTIRLYPDTTLSIKALPDTTLCTDSSINLYCTITGNAIPNEKLNVMWTSYPNDTTLKNPTAISQSINPKVSTTYYVELWGGACTKYDTFKLIRGQKLNLNFIKNNSLCNSPNGKIKAIVTNGYPPYQFQWNTGSPIDSISNLLPNLVYSLSVSDSLGCSASDSILLGNINKSLSLQLLKKDPTCFGLSDGSLKVKVLSGELGPFAYSWNPANLHKDSIFNLPAAAYKINVFDSTSNCIGIDSIILVSPAPVTLSSSVDSVTCYNKSDAIIRLAALGGIPPYQFQLNTGGFGFDSSFNALDTGTYRLFVKDSKACFDSILVSVNEPPALQMLLLKQDAACLDAANGKARIGTIGGGTPPYTFLWFNGQTLDSVLGIPPFTYAAITVSDAKNCMLRDSIFIDTSYVLRGMIVSDSVSCYNAADATAQISGLNGKAPYTYSWNNGATINPLTNLSAGRYTCTITDALGCRSVLRDTVLSPAAISILLNSSPITCYNGNDGRLSVIVSGGRPPYTYRWNNNVLLTDTFLAALGAGNYTFLAKDAKGCADSLNYQLTAPPKNISILVDSFRNVTCYDSANGFIAVRALGKNLPFSYLWNTGQNSAFIDGLKPLVVYTITVSDILGCSDTLSVTLKSPEPLRVSNLNLKMVSCPGLQDGWVQVSIAGGNASNNHPYQLSLNDTLYQTNRFFYNLPKGSYPLYLKDYLGCRFDTVFEITAPQELVYSISPIDTSIELMNSVVLKTEFNTSSGGAGNIQYRWSPVFGLSCTDCASPTAMPYRTTTYRLVATYNNQCSYFLESKIRVVNKPNLFIPSGFSPGNGDGVNDRFCVYGRGIKEVQLHIYNRWGELLFRGNGDENSGWDGRYLGQMQPIGIYTYRADILFVNGDSYAREGSVTIFR